LLRNFDVSARVKAPQGQKVEQRAARSETEMPQPWIQGTVGSTEQTPTAGNYRAPLDLSNAGTLLTVQYHFSVCIWFSCSGSSDLKTMLPYSSFHPGCQRLKEIQEHLLCNIGTFVILDILGSGLAKLSVWQKNLNTGSKNTVRQPC